jgi:signal transduction histidine kinase
MSMSNQIEPLKFESTVREMSHELRTPLTSIMGFSELLLEDESITGKNREYLSVISDESRKLSALLNHYLSILLVESEDDSK